MKTVKYYVVTKGGRCLLCLRSKIHQKMVKDLMTKPDRYFVSKNGYDFGKPKIMKVTTVELSNFAELGHKQAED